MMAECNPSIRSKHCSSDGISTDRSSSVCQLVHKFQIELKRFSDHDGRPRDQADAHHDSAMGPALPAGIREALEPIRSSGWGILEDGRDIWAYLYRAVDSAGETIEFMLSPKRGLIAAKLFLRLALSGGGPRPRVINVDGHPAYASAVAELKQTGELGPRSRCRTAPYLNNIIEQDHRCIKKRITASLGFRSVEGACRTIEGYEAMHAIRKGQVRWVARGDAIAQRQFIHSIFGIAA